MLGFIIEDVRWLEMIHIPVAFVIFGLPLYLTGKACKVLVGNFEVPSRIEEWEENRRIVASLGGVFPGVVTTTVMSEGDGARVTQRFDYGVKGGVAGKVLNLFLVERLNAKNDEWSLKKVCEAG